MNELYLDARNFHKIFPTNSLSTYVAFAVHHNCKHFDALQLPSSFRNICHVLPSLTNFFSFELD